MLENLNNYLEVWIQEHYHSWDVEGYCKKLIHNTFILCNCQFASASALNKGTANYWPNHLKIWTVNLVGSKTTTNLEMLKISIRGYWDLLPSSLLDRLYCRLLLDGSSSCIYWARIRISILTRFWNMLSFVSTPILVVCRIVTNKCNAEWYLQKSSPLIITNHDLYLLLISI